MAMLMLFMSVPSVLPDGATLWQITVRFGIPPGMPACDQSVARLGSRIPAQSWAWEYVEQWKNTARKSRSDFLCIMLDPSVKLPSLIVYITVHQFSVNVVWLRCARATSRGPADDGFRAHQ